MGRSQPTPNRLPFHPSLGPSNAHMLTRHPLWRPRCLPYRFRHPLDDGGRFLFTRGLATYSPTFPSSNHPGSKRNALPTCYRHGLKRTAPWTAPWFEENHSSHLSSNRPPVGGEPLVKPPLELSPRFVENHSSNLSSNRPRFEEKDSPNHPRPPFEEVRSPNHPRPQFEEVRFSNYPRP